jgi:hypothetical protein
MGVTYMLFHLSIEADDPRRVAEALAQIWGGEAFPFPPVGVGSWVALAGDEFGSMIEVYARGTELQEGGGGEGAFGVQTAPRRNGATHFAMGTSLSAEQVLTIASDNGWSAKYCRRADRFGLIEVWIDGCLMVEVLTKAMQREYLEAITIDGWRSMLSERTSALANAA